jgi:hypothetical protein
MAKWLKRAKQDDDVIKTLAMKKTSVLQQLLSAPKRKRDEQGGQAPAQAPPANKTKKMIRTK